jgi:hypothetical protein
MFKQLLWKVLGLVAVLAHATLVTGRPDDPPEFTTPTSTQYGTAMLHLHPEGDVSTSQVASTAQAEIPSTTTADIANDQTESTLEASDAADVAAAASTPSTSSQHLGRLPCGGPCGPGAICRSGKCMCLLRRHTACPNRVGCKALTTDPRNCGVCGRKCGPCQVCVAGSCVCPRSSRLLPNQSGCKAANSFLDTCKNLSPPPPPPSPPSPPPPPVCTPGGDPCDLNFPGLCCSQACCGVGFDPNKPGPFCGSAFGTCP